MSVSKRLSDEDLVALSRSGESEAFAELWRRHSRWALRVATGFTSRVDGEDLVAEAYARVFKLVSTGGGPEGAFRPYLYATMRHLAIRWTSDRREIPADDLAKMADPVAPADPMSDAADRELTLRAFHRLPERWQTVLLHTEIEGLEPQQIAPILGMSANGVAALSYRAREGLRRAWLQEQLTAAPAPGECGWVRDRLVADTRGQIKATDRMRFTAHLVECAECHELHDQMTEIGSRLARAVIPLVVGAGAGGLLTLRGGTAAVAASGSHGLVAVGAAGAPWASLVAAIAPGATAVGSLAVAAVSTAVLVFGGVAEVPRPQETTQPASVQIGSFSPTPGGSAALPLVTSPAVIAVPSADTRSARSAEQGPESGAAPADLPAAVPSAGVGVGPGVGVGAAGAGSSAVGVSETGASSIPRLPATNPAPVVHSADTLACTNDVVTSASCEP